MARKSQLLLPNPNTGEQELHHLETELAQVADMAEFARTLASQGVSASEIRRLLGIVSATESAEGLLAASDKKKLNAVYNNAAAHNGIYRGKDLTSYFNSGGMSAAIANGTFDDIYIGDYIIKTINLPAITYTDKAGTEKTQAAQTFSNVKWLVAGLDVHLHCGYNESADLAYGETQAHHALLIPSYTLQRNVKMNPTNDTEGGYLGSDMWRIHMPNWSAAIKAAFGAGHVLKHYEVLSNAVNKTTPSGAGAGWAGSASSWAWTEVEVNIPNEAMVYGGRTAGSFYDVGDFPRQLPLYALKRNHLNDRSWFWLRAVASASVFANASGGGDAYASGASASNGAGGIRPYFLLR